MDAFSISPIASSKVMSIILAKASDLQPSIKGLLEGKSKNNVYIAGGSDVVSD
ncbi:cell wall-binding protein [Clostridium botulinum A1 str. CFSAN002368]|nr:cell wall-binding protein [Clostridium botulinum A1 str. CFSAN002368]